LDKFIEITDEFYIIEQLDGYIKRLENILILQRESLGDTVQHIIAYREIKPDYDQIKENFDRILSTKKRANKKAGGNQTISLKGNLILNVPLFGILLFIVYLGYRNREELMRKFQYFGLTDIFQFDFNFQNRLRIIGLF